MKRMGRGLSRCIQICRVMGLRTESFSSPEGPLQEECVVAWLWGPKLWVQSISCSAGCGGVLEIEPGQQHIMHTACLDAVSDWWVEEETKGGELQDNLCRLLPWLLTSCHPASPGSRKRRVRWKDNSWRSAE